MNAAPQLTCPACQARLEKVSDQQLACSGCGAAYPIVSGRPVLLREGNPLFRISDYVDAKPKDYKRTGLSSYLPSITADLAVRRVASALAKRLDARGPSIVVIVGGGCQREWLTPIICADTAHTVIYTDIDTAADVEIFCDAHDLPFETNGVDAIITTAVLEHVMYPERVAGEITRVLKTGGLLYSEIPFMQQVHEGAYDFTRYTLSGHRRLFNGFSEIEAGMTAGPGSALAWSIESYARAFFRSSKMRQIVTGLCRIFSGLLKYTDRLLEKNPAAMDGACGTFFFGQKSDKLRSDEDIIAAYTGGRHLSHS